MPGKYPYANVNGGLIQLLDQLRKSFPGTVDADLLKKLDIAPKNESYVINVVRFLSLIDDDGKKTASGSKTFSLHEDEPFKAEFAKIVRTAYDALFEIYGDDAWGQPDGKLIAFLGRRISPLKLSAEGRRAPLKRLLYTLAALRVTTRAKSQRAGRPSPRKVQKSSPNRLPLPLKPVRHPRVLWATTMFH